jgi:uncharacterized repeat protein (TIGR03843 family)
VYKPVAGEQPLWDFPDGTLAQREVAAYVLSEAGGWGVVPPTVLRDGPFGPGSVQLWVGAPEPDLDPGAGLVDVVDPDEVPPGWHTVVEGSGAHGAAVLLVHADDPVLRRMAAFDVVANNADRKGGHVLRGGGRVWGVDHGLTFHTDPKLRTVLWGWAGERLGADVTACLGATETALAGDLTDALAELVTPAELDALADRVDRLRARDRFPRPRPGAPALPWPPF